MRRVEVVVFVLLTAGLCFAEAPALPAGLGGGPSENAAPELPSGLDIPTASPALPQGLGGLEEQPEQALEEDSGLGGLTGFLEMRFGARTQGAGYEDKVSIAETRLQLEYQHFFDEFTFDFAGDLLFDATNSSQSVDIGTGRD